MKKKKYTALLCAAVLTCGAFLCGCSSTEAETEATQTTEAEMTQPMTMGEITAIDGTTVTLALRGGRGGMGGEMGERPEMPEGMEKPDGEAPEGMEKPDGDMPEMKEGQEPSARPEGELPEGMEKPDGDMPENMEMPEEQTITIDLSAFDTVNVEELAVGDMLSVELDADGNVLSVAAVALSQMPEMGEKGPKEKPEGETTAEG